ncbi:MAG TPA: aminotransferase class V-fold PLP-dependent enzyme [Alphaproteobacteria bacterium]|nr:aminotransferase class V-fold PLP-dependent enzyme [Alphaproteobacteria bacterium]
MTEATDGQPDDGYLLYHSIGMFPGKAARMGEALAEFAAFWGRADDAQWQTALARRQEFIDRWRRLINVPAGTLTTAENVTTALFSIVGGLPEHHLKGRRVLIAADCFPSLHFLLARLADRFGFTLDTVPIGAGANWVTEEDFIARWDETVGLALITWVTSTTSHRSDVARLVEHGRRMGSLAGVDITQGVGVLPFDAGSLGVDFTISTSLKWLCGAPGAGILHVREELLGECRPELRGWFSQENIFSWDLDKFAYAPDARRFDHGTPSVVSAIGSLPGLEWHAGQDMAALLAHNRRLTAMILEAAPGLGLTPVSPQDPDKRGGSLMLRLPAGADPAGVVDRLRRASVYADCRGRILRLSPGPITTQAGIDRLVRELAMTVKTDA